MENKIHGRSRFLAGAKRTIAGAMLLLLYGLVGGVPVFARPFPLTDSGPGSPAFRERFLASYGVNAAIEPTLGVEDRKLYERIAPYLHDDQARAIREVEAALAPDSNPAYRFLLGNLYYEAGDWEKSERYLREAIARFPDFRRAHRTLGLVLIQEGRYSEAVDTWLTVIRLGGGDAQSYGLLAYSYLTLEKYESALHAYRAARMYRPDSIDFRRGQAQCLLQTGQWRLAAALFDELIAEQPETAELWFMQANAFLRLEEFEQAVANLELAHSLGGRTADSQFLLGDLHLRGGSHRLAVEAYLAAIEETSGWSIDQALLPLRHLIGRNLIEEGARYLERLRTVLPENSLDPDRAEEIAVIDAQIAALSDRPEEALGLLETIVEKNPLNGDALLLFGEVLKKDGDDERARFYLERALSLPEHQVDARIALGRLEVDRKNFSAALEHLRAAAALESRPGLDRYIEAIAEAARAGGVE